MTTKTKISHLTNHMNDKSQSEKSRVKTTSLRDTIGGPENNGLETKYMWWGQGRGPLTERITLLDDDVSCLMVDWKHGVENVCLFCVVQMRKENVLGNGFGQRSHCGGVFRNNLRVKCKTSWIMT